MLNQSIVFMPLAILVPLLTLYYTINIGLNTSTVLLASLVALVIYLLNGGSYTLWLAYKTLPRDIRLLYRYIKVRLFMRAQLKNNLTVPMIFKKSVDKHPHKAAFIFEDRKWTFLEIDEYSNRIANYLLTRGLKRHDSITLFMENRPEYVATWLGCSKIGVAVALMNSNLKGGPLLHSIKVSESKLVICGAEIQHVVGDIFKDLDRVPILVSGLKNEPICNSEFVNLDENLNKASKTTPKEIDDGNIKDKLLYIYTSGTTGLPKAAIIKDYRYTLYACALHYLSDMQDGPVYNPLPLYHTAGCIIGVGQALIHGCTVVIRKKFSVSNFWKEAAKYECRVAQYIGEMCRYLLNASPTEEDKQHKIKIMVGNGLRPHVWDEFVKRFGINQISEIYGSTEGVANLINTDGQIGACGFLPLFMSSFIPGQVIRYNKETGEVVRDENGLCIPCKNGEPGIYVGMIRENLVASFHGYTNKRANEKKVITNVLKKGDSAYLSGDVLVRDEFGYVYFKDRLGDTFRWRGENVSTAEVEGMVSQMADNMDAVVYGVEIPGAEGKAGMAAIVDPTGALDMSQLAQRLRNVLPSYAIPIFIRIVDEIETTGTYKLRKVDLQKEGYDPRLIEEKLYFFNNKLKSYEALTDELYKKIERGDSGL